MRSSEWALIHYDWCHKDRRYEDTGRRQPSTSQGERPPKKPTLPTPWSWASTLLKGEEMNFYCLSHPICGTLVWRPQQTNTIPISSLVQASPMQTQMYRHHGTCRNICVWSQTLQRMFPCPTTALLWDVGKGAGAFCHKDPGTGYFPPWEFPVSSNHNDCQVKIEGLWFQLYFQRSIHSFKKKTYSGEEQPTG